MNLSYRPAGFSCIGQLSQACLRSRRQSALRAHFLRSRNHFHLGDSPGAADRHHPKQEWSASTEVIQVKSAPEGIRTPNLLTYSAVSEGLGESARVWL